MCMPDDTVRNRRTVLQSIAAVGFLSGGVAGVSARTADTQGTASSGNGRSDRLQQVVPVPVEVKSTGNEYTVTSETAIHVDSDEATDVATYLADVLRPSTGYQLPVVDAPATGAAGG